MTVFRAVWLSVAVLVSGTGPAASAAEAPLRVSAAISLRPALEEAFEAYRADGAVGRIVLNSAGSGVLLQQARRGAPADVLISASSREIDLLLDEGLALANTRRRIASNRLVIVVPRGAEPPRELAALAGPEFGALAVANPRTAPLGRYTRQALESLGLWSRLKPRLVPAENARQTLEYVARAEVEAGVVYATDARLLGERVRSGLPLDGDLHDPIGYEGVVLADTRRPEAAAALLEWLASPRGAELFARHGFLAP